MARGAHLTCKYLCHCFKRKITQIWSEQNFLIWSLGGWSCRMRTWQILFNGRGKFFFPANEYLMQRKVSLIKYCAGQSKTCWAKSVLGELLLLWKENISLWILKGTITKQGKTGRKEWGGGGTLFCMFMFKSEVKSVLKDDHFCFLLSTDSFTGLLFNKQLLFF